MAKKQKSKYRELMDSMKLDTPEKIAAMERDIDAARRKRPVREYDEPTTLEELEEVEEFQKQHKGKKTFKAPGQLRSVGMNTKVSTALRATGNSALANKIAGCVSRSRCSSFYCGDCRDRAAKNFVARVNRRIEDKLDGDPDLVQQRFRYVTVLHEVVPFDASSVMNSVEKCRVALNAFHRRFQDVWLQGAFEFELIDLDHLSRIKSGNGLVKRQTMEGMLQTLPTGLKILVHFHAILDLVDEDEAVVKSWLKSRWSDHSKQVDVRVTEKGQPLEDKIWKMCSYCFKNRTQFNDTFVTRDFELGKDFTNEQLGKLVTLYQEFLDASYGSIRGLLIQRGNAA